jgi:hypothetical protein
MSQSTRRLKLAFVVVFGAAILILAIACLIPSKTHAKSEQIGQQQEYPAAQAKPDQKSDPGQSSWQETYIPTHPLPKAEAKGGLQDYVQAQPQPKTDLPLERQAYAAKVRASYNFTLVKGNISLPGNAAIEGDDFIQPGAFPNAKYCAHCIRRLITSGGRHCTPTLSALPFIGQASTS